MANPRPPFWVVWTPADYSLTKTYQTAGAAQEAAMSLARTNPDQSFFVLEPAVKVVSGDVVVTHFEPMMAF